MTTKTEQKPVPALGRERRCKDFDEDCASVPGVTPSGHVRSHLDCWLYDPSKGWCPFLRSDT